MKCSGMEKRAISTCHGSAAHQCPSMCSCIESNIDGISAGITVDCHDRVNNFEKLKKQTIIEIKANEIVSRDFDIFPLICLRRLWNCKSCLFAYFLSEFYVFDALNGIILNQYQTMLSKSSIVWFDCKFLCNPFLAPMRIF